jgi:hypothetical protein
MSTHGAIARPIADGWEGRYHHADSYPTQLGRTLWTLYHGHFARDVAAMMAFLIDEHPAGWSTIVDADFTQPAGFPAGPHAPGQGPACYCHGARAEAPQRLHEHGGCQDETCNPQAITWVYVLGPVGMAVLASQEDQHRPVGFVRWDDIEPDWEQLERSAAGA